MMSNNLFHEKATIAVVGNVDSGKSSFIGVIKHGEYDDGNGSARSKISKLRHELESGKTSSHSYHYIYNNNNITTLIDLCGHEKYYKTTAFGISGLFPDYGMVMISASDGINHMTIEHIALMLFYGIPFIVVVTKIDICPESVYNSNMNKLLKIFSKTNKRIQKMNNDAKIISTFENDVIEKMNSKENQIFPLFEISNKTGYGIECLKNFIISLEHVNRSIPKHLLINYVIRNEEPFIFYLDSAFSINGIGNVVSGKCIGGNITFGQKMYLGPISGRYIQITAKNLHDSVCNDVKIIPDGTSGSVALRLSHKDDFSKKLFKKGMILTNNINFARKYTSKKITVELKIGNQKSNIRNGFQSIVHCGTVMQSAKITSDGKKFMKAGSTHIVELQFCLRPEFILPESKFILRINKTVASGTIKSIN